MDVTAGQAYACRWRLELHHNKRSHMDAGIAARIKGSRVASASSTPRFGVWHPCENPGLQPNGWNFGDRENENVDGDCGSDCGAGVCGGFPNSIGNNSTEHRAHDGDPDYAEVVVGGTHKTCRGTCSFGNQTVEDQGCNDLNKLRSPG